MKLKSIMAFICAAAVAAPAAMAQETAQVIDRVASYNRSSVIDMQFNDPNRTADFDVLINERGSQFSSCDLSAGTGLWCLDGALVVQWPEINNPASRQVESFCEDPVLGFNPDEVNGCFTRLAVDNGGSLYLAGPTFEQLNQVMKLLPSTDGLCPEGYSALTVTTRYCYLQVVSFLSTITDMNVIEGDKAARSVFSERGLIVLEETGTVSYVTDSGSRYELLTFGSPVGQFFNLNDPIQSVDYTQIPLIGETPQPIYEDYLVIARLSGQIFAAPVQGFVGGFVDEFPGGFGDEIPGDFAEIFVGDLQLTFDVLESRRLESTICTEGPDTYGIRVSSNTDTVYVSDMLYCEVSALTIGFDQNGFVEMVNKTEGNSVLTLDTASGQGSFPPLALAIAPGELINLEECVDECVLLESEEGDPLVIYKDVETVQGTPVDLTIQQIVNVLDCRYIPDRCVEQLGLFGGGDPMGALINAGVIIDPSGLGEPAAQFLNITPLLPADVRDQFPTGLPDLYLPRYYRAQDRGGPSNPNHRTFDLLFGETDAIFRGVSELQIFVGDLAGSELGCPKVTPPNFTPISQLLQYDVGVALSEDYRSASQTGLPSGPAHVGALSNSGCGTSRLKRNSWSFIPFNLEFTPDSYLPVSNVVIDNDPRVFEQVLYGILRELNDTARQFACRASDGQAAAPLSRTACRSALGRIRSLQRDFQGCFNASLGGDLGARATSCNRAKSRAAQTVSYFAAQTSQGTDPANRVGELEKRAIVIENVLINLYLPSVPEAGFGTN